MDKHLFLVRHAQAETSSHVQKDFDRLLTSTGFAEALKMGERLVRQQVKPSLIVTSPADRCAATAQLLAERLQLKTEDIVPQPDLYEASVRSLMNVINGLEEDKNVVLLVGHNPAISYLAEFLTHTEIGSMPTCAVVHVVFENLAWAQVSGQTGTLAFFDYPDNNGEEM